MGVGIESATQDDCERLRDATDLIEERKTMPRVCVCVCVCEEDSIIIIVLCERIREISLVSSFFCLFGLFMGLGRTSVCI